MGYRPTTSDDPMVLRASAALTTSYVASSPMRVKGMNALQMLLNLTLDTGGGATSANMQIEMASPSGNATPVATDWYCVTAKAVGDPTVATGLAPIGVGRAVLNFTLTDKYLIQLSQLVNEGNIGKWIRVLIKTTAGPGTSTAAVSLVGGTS